MPTTTRSPSDQLTSQIAQQSAVMLSDAIAATTISACYDTSTKYRRRRAALLLFSILLTFPTNHAFLYPTSNLRLISQPILLSKVQKNRMKLYQRGPGSTNDYLSNISSKNERNDEGKVNNETSISDKASSNNPISKVQSALNNVASSVSNEIGKRTSEMASGLASVAELGGSDIQSLASTAKSNVEKVTKKGTWDVRRVSWRAQNAVKKSADGIVATGSKGLSDLHFFEVVRFTPKIKAEDIVNWIDSQARSGTDIVSSKAKTLVLNFTGKKEYQFGDVTKELVHRVATQEVNMQDTLLLLKILLAIGATVGPLAELMPFTLLIEALNISLEQKVGGKILEVLSQTLDKRLVAALFTSDDKNLIGDVVKRTVLSGVLQFTGKTNYESGDIQRAVQRGQAADCTDEMNLDLDIDSEFEEWDRRFVEKMETEDYLGAQAKVMDMKIAIALEECDSILQRKNAEKNVDG